MSQGNEDSRIHILLANEYCVDFPLWPDDDEIDVENLGLSDALSSDLRAFAARWEAAVPAEIFDDRWDGVPVMQQLVDVRYALQRLLNPAGRRQAKAEDEAMQARGEDLRTRLERELGPGYRVTYQHF